MVNRDEPWSLTLTLGLNLAGDGLVDVMKVPSPFCELQSTTTPPEGAVLILRLNYLWLYEADSILF